MRLERRILLECLNLLLKPVIKFAVRHSIKIQELNDVIKTSYLSEATECLQENSQKITDSRLSIITGMQRRDITKFKDLDGASIGTEGLITKVVGQWQNDKYFNTSGGKPRVLSSGFKNSDFDKLVRKVSQDLNSATVLFELERSGIVMRSKGGIQLAAGTHIVRDDIKEGFKIVSQDSNDLLNAVEENFLRNEELQNHHLRTTYDRIRSEALPEIKGWLLREGHEFHRKARDFISAYDQDIKPKSGYKDSFSKVVITSFSKTYEEKK